MLLGRRVSSLYLRPLLESLHVHLVGLRPGPVCTGLQQYSCIRSTCCQYRGTASTPYWLSTPVRPKIPPHNTTEPRKIARRPKSCTQISPRPVCCSDPGHWLPTQLLAHTVLAGGTRAQRYHMRSSLFAVLILIVLYTEFRTGRPQQTCSRGH